MGLYDWSRLRNYDFEINQDVLKLFEETHIEKLIIIITYNNVNIVLKNNKSLLKEKHHLTVQL